MERSRNFSSNNNISEVVSFSGLRGPLVQQGLTLQQPGSSVTRVTDFCSCFPDDETRRKGREQADGGGGDRGPGGHGNEGRLDRVTNALTPARDVKENGDEVAIVFDEAAFIARRLSG